MDLQFSRKEQTAITNLAAAIILADGKVDERENLTFAKEMIRLGVTEEQISDLISDAKRMEPSKAISIVSALGNEEKKYVAAFLVTLMAADGNIANEELKRWGIMSTLSGLPALNVKEALAIMRNL